MVIIFWKKNIKMYKRKIQKRVSFFSRTRRALLISLVDLLIIVGLFSYVSSKRNSASQITKDNIKISLKILNLKKNKEKLSIFQIENISKKTQILNSSICSFVILSNQTPISTNKKFLQFNNQKIDNEFCLKPKTSVYAENLYKSKANTKIQVFYNYKNTVLSLKP